MRILLVALLVLLAGSAHAAPEPKSPAPLIVNPEARDGVRLDGDWQVIVDPLSNGDSSPVAVGVEGSGFYQDVKQTSPAQLIEYKFSDKNRLKVPGDWNSQTERLFFYQGPVWYRTTFAAPASPGRKFLYFGAVNYRADVYLNGKHLASHEGGFTPFNVDVTDRLRAGDNLLVVKVDNTLSADTVPTRKTDWMDYGGITRSVRLITVPSAYVRSYAWRLVDLERRLIEVTVETDGTVAGDKVSIAIPSLRKTAAIVVDGAGQGQARFKAPVALWSPQHPTLYDVSVTLGASTVRDRIGFRTIEAKGGELLLNGRPIFLKGIAMHEESLTHPGRSFGEADARASLQMVKALGANFVRLAHYPHDEATTRMADELGLLVWSEIPVYWSINWNSAATLATAKTQLSENIRRDANRASIIVWSVANETPMSPARLTFLKTLVQTARQADPSRLVSAALFGDPFGFLKTYSARIMAHIAIDPVATAEQREAAKAWLRDKAGIDPTAARLAELSGPLLHVIDDPLGDDLDIVAYNEYFAWYPAGVLAKILPVDEPTIRRTEFKVMQTLEIEPRQNKPFVVSEFGADAKSGFTGDEDTVFSEAFQARYYAAQIAMLRRSEKLRGISPWVLKDFRSPLRTHPDYQEYFNRKGLVDEQGRKKAAFGVLQSLYSSMGDASRLAPAHAQETAR